MSNKKKGFEKFVIIFVIVTGAGFGGLTGIGYAVGYWWLSMIVGMTAGAVSGYPLAKLYLKQLIKISAKERNRKAIWFSSTLVAIICGVICTTLVHGIMTLMLVCESDVPYMKQEDGFYLMFLLLGELVGACAGFIVGGICSLVYVKKVMGKVDEAIDTA